MVGRAFICFQYASPPVDVVLILTDWAFNLHCKARFALKLVIGESAPLQRGRTF